MAYGLYLADQIARLGECSDLSDWCYNSVVVWKDNVDYVVGISMGSCSIFPCRNAIAKILTFSNDEGMIGEEREGMFLRLTQILHNHTNLSGR